MARLAAAPLLAASFLTIAPVPAPRSLVPGSMGWAVACFPLAGGILGALLAAADRLLSLRLPPLVVAALLLALLLGVTGALHLDGLMDSFDGLFGGRDPAGRLAIMRDSRVGSFGVAAGALLLLTEYGALASLPGESRGVAMILAVTLSRWAMAAVLWSFPPAGSSGLAAGLKPEVRWHHLAAATLVAAAIAGGCSGWFGMGLGLVAAVLVALGGGLAMAKLGGINGDLCGGLGQVVEAATLVLCVAAATPR